MFRTVSQVGVNYRESPLSEGTAGDIRGGDRLPWTRTGPDEDNFAPLTSLSWQVHVYGEPRDGVAEACAGLGLPLLVFGWRPEMQRSGLLQGALYLIRPDGYIARADSSGDPRRLASYFASRGLPVARAGVVGAPGPSRGS
jgi:hypothetical protein